MSLIKKRERLQEVIATLQTQDAEVEKQELQELIGNHVSFDEMQKRMHESPERLEKQIRSITSAEEFAWLKGNFFALQSHRTNIEAVIKGVRADSHMYEFSRISIAIPTHLLDAPSETESLRMLSDLADDLADLTTHGRQEGLVDRFSLAFVTGASSDHMPKIIKMMNRNGLLMLQERGSGLYIPTPEMAGVEKY